MKTATPSLRLAALVAFTLAAGVVVAAGEARAQEWSDVAPGLSIRTRAAHSTRVNEARVDLCAAGVSVRATRPEESPSSVEGFAAKTGAELVVNGDFFKNGRPVGFAVGDGVEWNPDVVPHNFVAFGPGRVEFEVAAEAATKADPAWSWVTQAVGGAPSLAIDGAPTHNVLGHCAETRARTAVGLSEDAGILFIVVVDENRGMTCNELASHMVSLGASKALNLDGGGSSEMWVKGRGVVSQSSSRSPANHLAILAKGPGDGSYCPLPPARTCEPVVTRVAGADRFETAAQLAGALRPDAETVILVNGESDEMPDALAAGPLSSKLGAPVLATAAGFLPEATRAHLASGTAKKVIVVGGTNAISASVEAELASMGLSVERISGADRFETAAAIARRIESPEKIAFIASGEGANLVDALSAGPVASHLGAPILLVRKDGVPEATRQVIGERNLQRLYVVGGESAVSEAVFEELGAFRRISGASRFDTAVEMAEFGLERGMSAESAWIARADRMVDALAVGGFPRFVLLSETARLTGATSEFLSVRSETAVLLGGPAALSARTEEDACIALGALGEAADKSLSASEGESVAKSAEYAGDEPEAGCAVATRGGSRPAFLAALSALALAGMARRRARR